MRVRRPVPLVIALAVTLAMAACRAPAPEAPPTSAETPAATSTAEPAKPTPAATASVPRGVLARACPPGDLPPPPDGETRDAWTRARAMLPAGVTVYRPAAVPSRFGPATLLAACLEPDDIPQLTVVYRVGGEYLAFLINGGQSIYGNTPGPPTSIEKLNVRGVAATLTTLTGADSAQPAASSLALSWREGLVVYQIKTSSVLMTGEDLRALAEGLVRVE